MPPSPYHPGKAYYAKIPEEHTVGREQHDNPNKGARPWVILWSRDHRNTGLVIAAPVCSEGQANRSTHIAFTVDDVNSDRCEKAGWIRLEQTRSLSVERLDRTRVWGTFTEMKVMELRSGIEGMLGSDRMNREQRRRRRTK